VTPAPPQPSSSSKTPSFADDSGSSCFQVFF
jgi:hypothetical protein